MKLTLITPTPSDICAFGVRSLSAYMKREGYSVKNIFLPTSLKGRQSGSEFIFTYSERILDDVINIAKDSGVIGISFMTNYFDAAVQITKKIQMHLNIPIIWGGTHPTVKPKECLNYVDAVCIGEGEEALAEYLKKISVGESYYSIRNFWFRKNGKIIQNSMRPLIKDLDSLPFYDFDLNGQYVSDIRKDRVVELDSELFRSILPREAHFNDTMNIAFKTYFSRGCPYQCSYCINDHSRKMYPGQKYFRIRSVKNVIAELELLRNTFPFLETFVLFDDTFIARTTNDIQSFSKAYKQRIGLPFHIQVSPTTISKQKMECLVDAGLVFVEMGIQTGCEKTKKLYQRQTSNEQIFQAVKIIHSFQSRLLHPCYHVILDNPWETPEDVLETLNVIMRIPKSFWLKRASLVFFPGTMLYKKAKEENLIKDEYEEVYRKNLIVPSHSYINFLMYLAGQNYCPRFVVKVLSQRKLVAYLCNTSYNKIFGFLQTAFEIFNLIIKGLKSSAKGDFRKIFLFLKRRFGPTN